MDSMKNRLANGEKLVVFAVGRMFHPNIIQYLGMTGDFDGFWIDKDPVTRGQFARFLKATGYQVKYNGWVVRWELQP